MKNTRKNTIDRIIAAIIYVINLSILMVPLIYIKIDPHLVLLGPIGEIVGLFIIIFVVPFLAFQMSKIVACVLDTLVIMNKKKGGDE